MPAITIINPGLEFQGFPRPDDDAGVTSAANTACHRPPLPLSERIAANAAALRFLLSRARNRAALEKAAPGLLAAIEAALDEEEAHARLALSLEIAVALGSRLP